MQQQTSSTVPDKDDIMRTLLSHEKSTSSGPATGLSAAAAASVQSSSSDSDNDDDLAFSGMQSSHVIHACSDKFLSK